MERNTLARNIVANLFWLYMKEKWKNVSYLSTRQYDIHSTHVLYLQEVFMLSRDLLYSNEIDIVSSRPFFTRTTKDKVFSTEQNNCFDKYGFICHMVNKKNSFDEIVKSIREYYEFYLDTLLEWDFIVSHSNHECLASIKDHLEYKFAEEKVALALIRLCENNLIEIDHD